MPDKINLDNDARYSLAGRVVTMDDKSTVLKKGVVYIHNDKIVAVKNAKDPAPDGFTKSKTIKSGGTIYPGLIELHNHLSYNVIPLWDVPKQYSNRNQWRTHKDYRKLITGPLKILGSIDGHLQAIVRYVECKCLFSGVTSSQGITLSSHGGIRKHYKGVVRNVEQTVDPELPAAKTRIADVDAKSPEKLLKRLEQSECLLLHLAEGTTTSSNKHFKALKITNNKWAITSALCGIHAMGLLPEDFEILGKHNGSMVWSPTSNLILYGATADIAAAKNHGVLIGLGSDWAPSGSKNLLCELKVAALVNKEMGDIFSKEELVRMATSNAAKILKWQDSLGSIEAGKKADLLVLRGRRGEVYKNLIEARETTINKVIIGGIPRLGTKRLMDKFGLAKEQIKIGKSKRYINLEIDQSINPIAVNLSFKEAASKLKVGLAQLPQLAKKVEKTNTGIFAGATDLHRKSVRWKIESDHEDTHESSQRHHLVDADHHQIFEAKSAPLSEILEPVALDPELIANDKFYFNRFAGQRNLPEYIKLKLPQQYGKKINLSQGKELLPPTVSKHVGSLQSLAEFYKTPGYLTQQDKVLLVDQAMVTLSQAYVHLPLKKAMHASNPLERLRVLKTRLSNDDRFTNEIDFHKAMISIFNNMRDLHTLYYLPRPFKDKVTFLPFFIEEYFEDGEPRYIVSKVFGKVPSPHFKKGVNVTYWNGTPIGRAIKINADRYAGSNPAARHARGLDSMTFKPLAVMLPPDEDRVTIGYTSDNGGKNRKLTIDWAVASVYDAIVSDDELQGVANGYDYSTARVNLAKKFFIAPEVIRAEAKSRKNNSTQPKAKKGYIQTNFPGHFRAKKEHKNKYGYIRIFSFGSDRPKEFVSEFIRLLKQMPTTGLILDVRNNGGGNINACEWMLQTLTKRSIKPQSGEFINTQFMEQLCERNSPSSLVPELNLANWDESFQQIRKTGSVYTLGYPITTKSSFRPFKFRYPGKVVLITDALCYSATDIFAAGFQDHGIGEILGVHENTGAGGANVWSHSLLLDLATADDNGSSDFKPLPYGADFKVAVRRTIRVAGSQGIPLEDLGVKPDHLHLMTKRDLLEGNYDLVNEAISILDQME